MLLGIIAMVCVAILGLGIANFRALRYFGLSPAGEGVDLKKLALRLEERGLREEAIETWREYVEKTGPEAKERAVLWYRLGRLSQEAGLYEDALGFLYRAEAHPEHLDEEVRGEIGMRVTECLERLGRFGAAAAERTERASLHGGGQDRGEVIAIIGKEEIRRADLDEYLEAEAEASVAFLQGLPPEQVAEVRQQAYRRLAAPETRAARLEELVAKRVLLRKSKALELDKDDAVREQFDRVRQALLAETLMRQVLTDRIHVTQGDLRRHYEAHLDDYRKEGEEGKEGVPRPFEEVKDEVRSAYYRLKRAEVQSEFIADLFREHGVEIYRDRVRGSAGGKEEGDEE